MARALKLAFVLLALVAVVFGWVARELRPIPEPDSVPPQAMPAPARNDTELLRKRLTAIREREKAAAPVVERARTPARFPAPRDPGLTPESHAIWLDAESTVHDIELAHAMDVCACPDVECVRALQTAFFMRRKTARRIAVDQDDDDAVRQMRMDCLDALSSKEYASAR